MTIGYVLRAYQARTGIMWKDLAKKLKTSNSALRDWRDNDRIPYADAVGCILQLSLTAEERSAVLKCAFRVDTLDLLHIRVLE